MGLRRTSHSVYDTTYHLVWCPKYRKDIFREEWLKERAEQLFAKVAEEFDIEMLELEVSADHVHLMVSFPPKRGIGEVVRIFKSVVARELFREFPSLKRRLWGGEVWEDGYFARTVGDRMTSEVVEKYIRRHREEKQGDAQLDLELR
jgi:putative transposase